MEQLGFIRGALMTFVLVLILSNHWEISSVYALYVPFYYYDRKYIQKDFTFSTNKKRKGKYTIIISLMALSFISGLWVARDYAVGWTMFWGVFLVCLALWIPMFYDIADYLINRRERKKNPRCINRHRY